MEARVSQVRENTKVWKKTTFPGNNRLSVQSVHRVGEGDGDYERLLKRRGSTIWALTCDQDRCWGPEACTTGVGDGGREGF